MAQGFGSTAIRTASTKTAGYETLFEKVKTLSSGQKKSIKWYRSAVKSESGKYKKNFNNKGSTEVSQTQNELRNTTLERHIYMFEYQAKMRWLPYYDKFPLVYVLKSKGSEFTGINLHYLSPKKRIIATKKLLQGRIDVPKACFHKYLHNHVQEGVYIDLAQAEWDSAILLPTEEFVKSINGMNFPIDKKLVWKDTDEAFYDKITGQSK